MIDEGAGFPTMNRDLARRRTYSNDPNGYYALLELPPSATDDQVRKRIRLLLRKYHPDGWMPNRERFDRLLEMRETLLDPVQRAYYENTPIGNKYLDKTLLGEILERVKEEGGDPKEFLDSLTLVGQPFFSYFVLDNDLRMGDRELAQEWYRVLLHVGYFMGLKGTIRVRLVDHQGISPFVGEEVSVPRDFPTISKAVELLSNRMAVVPAC